jgi:putative oligomerization/nucleic acid binding protein
MVKLRQLTQLRDSGAITEAEFQTKKMPLPVVRDRWW